MRLDPNARKQFDTDGAIKLPNLLDDSALASCRACFDWSVSHPGPLSSTISAGLGNSMYTDASNPGAVKVYEPMLRSLPFADILAELWGSEHVWFFGEEIFVKRGGNVGRTPWHQDTSYLLVVGEHLANFWISFDALPKANSLELVRGSHHGPEYSGQGTFQDTVQMSRVTDDDFEADPRPLLPPIEAERSEDPNSWDVVSWEVEPGDVVLTHLATLHGGAPVDEHCPERHAMALRFFGDDAFYRPLPYANNAPAEPSLKEGEPYRLPRFLQLR